LEKRKRLSILCEMERLSHYRGNLGTCISLLYQWKHAKRISTSTSTIGTDWTIKDKIISKRRKTIKSQRNIEETLAHIVNISH
jgi:dTDP-4-dehydrorhamnose 3,5-epimerase-like enzyme